MSDKKFATFFGGAIDDKTTTEYSETILIGEFLSSNGYTVKNGGYRGLMEAVSIGATSNWGETIGFTCATFPSTKGNDYLTETVVCDDIYDRLKCLIVGSDIFVAQSGGIGTISELTLVLDEARKRKVKPKVFVIGQIWKNIFEQIKVIMTENDFKMLVFCENYSDFVSKF